MSKKIILRADGNRQTGLGHLYRLIGLAECLKGAFSFCFLTRASSAVNTIPQHYETIIIPESISVNCEPSWLKKIFSAMDSIVITDGYQFDFSYQQSIKANGFQLVYIDDFASRAILADIIINHSPNVKKEDFEGSTYDKLALGTKYSLLRPTFLAQAGRKRTFTQIDVAFVCFGGSDFLDLTFKAVSGLLKIPAFKHIHVVLGNAYIHKKIYQTKKEHPSRISVHQNLSEQSLVDIMLCSNFAVAPASTILFELCCVGIPIFSGFYIDNQNLIYDGFLSSKAISGGGNFGTFDSQAFYHQISKVLKEEDFESQLRSQRLMFDAFIAHRHINLIKKIC